MKKSAVLERLGSGPVNSPTNTDRSCVRLVNLHIGSLADRVEDVEHGLQLAEQLLIVRNHKLSLDIRNMMEVKVRRASIL